MLRTAMFGLCLALCTPLPAAASDATRIQSRDAFVSLVKDRALTRFGITLTVLPDGAITGRAFGRPVRGDWNWRGSYFCRNLWFGDEPLGPNCQVVELRGNALRFIADEGRGDHADLRLR
ncbi:MAG: dihydrodipicolinate reductase [Gemmobacter sp.]